MSEIHPSIDLETKFLGVRNQGERATCLAFSLSALHEFSRTSEIQLSVEHLHFFSKQQQGHFDGSGIEMQYGVAAINTDGQGLENECPYLHSEPPESWSPLEPKEYIVFSAEIVETGTSAIKSLLSKNRPVVVGLEITDQWLQGTQVIEHDGTYPAIGGHAVVVVGYGNAEKGEGFFRIRNSWGDQWAQSGYCWVSEAYFENRLIGVIG